MDLEIAVQTERICDDCHHHQGHYDPYSRAMARLSPKNRKWKNVGWHYKLKFSNPLPHTSGFSPQNCQVGSSIDSLMPKVRKLFARSERGNFPEQDEDEGVIPMRSSMFFRSEKLEKGMFCVCGFYWNSTDIITANLYTSLQGLKTLFCENFQAGKMVELFAHENASIFTCFHTRWKKSDYFDVVVWWKPRKCRLEGANGAILRGSFSVEKAWTRMIIILLQAFCEFCKPSSNNIFLIFCIMFLVSP